MRHAGAARGAANDIAVVRRTIVAVIAESGGSMATIGRIALRLPSARVFRNVAVGLRVANSAADGIIFGVGANAGIGLVERKFTLTRRHSII